MAGIQWDMEKMELEISHAVDKITQGVIDGVEKAGTYVEGEVKRMAPVDTGQYRVSIRADDPLVYENNVIVVIGTPLPQACQLEYGGTIRAKDGGYLKFQIGGQWVQVREVYQPPKPHFRPAFDMSRQRVHDIIAEEIRKETANG